MCLGNAQPAKTKIVCKNCGHELDISLYGTLKHALVWNACKYKRCKCGCYNPELKA